MKRPEIRRFFKRILFGKKKKKKKLKGNAQFFQNTSFALRERTMPELQKMFRKIPKNTYATISVMLVC